MRVDFHSFACEYPIFPTVSFSHYVLLTPLLKIKLTKYVWIDFWAPYSTPLAYMSVFIPILFCSSTVALQYILKPGCVMTPALYFCILFLWKFETVCGVTQSLCFFYFKNYQSYFIDIALDLLLPWVANKFYQMKI